jgi:Na+-transporting methylmalonyl-CoA/oxaloacetate decarboxylase gamma subunit
VGDINKISMGGVVELIGNALTSLINIITTNLFVSVLTILAFLVMVLIFIKQCRDRSEDNKRQEIVVSEIRQSESETQQQLQAIKVTVEAFTVREKKEDYPDVKRGGLKAADIILILIVGAILGWLISRATYSNEKDEDEWEE